MTGPSRRAGTVAGTGHVGRVLVVRLGPGEDLLPALEQMLASEAITTGIILGGVASLEHASIRNIHRLPARYPITPADRTRTTIPGPLEVLAMQGNVAPTDDGEVVVHCHLEVSLGAPAGATFGGHLVEDTIVATTAEVSVAELAGIEVRRRLDPLTQALELTVDQTAGGAAR